MKQVDIVVERHSDGYVAYPLGITGVVVGEGDTYEEALADVKSALVFHVETFGPDVIAFRSLKGWGNMTTISIDDIQSDLAGYLRNAKAGETFLVTQHGQPIAEIKPVVPAEEGKTKSLRPIGLAEGEFVVPDDFDAPLPEDILRDFEGRGRS